MQIQACYNSPDLSLGWCNRLLLEFLQPKHCFTGRYLFTEREARWETEGDFEISTPRSFEFWKVWDAHFRNRPLSLSTNNAVRYLVCISLNSLDFKDCEIAICGSASSKLFCLKRKKPEVALKMAESCLGPYHQTPYLRAKFWDQRRKLTGIQNEGISFEFEVGYKICIRMKGSQTAQITCHSLQWKDSTKVSL